MTVVQFKTAAQLKKESFHQKVESSIYHHVTSIETRWRSLAKGFIENHYPAPPSDLEEFISSLNMSSLSDEDTQQFFTFLSKREIEWIDCYQKIVTEVCLMQRYISEIEYVMQQANIAIDSKYGE